MRESRSFRVVGDLRKVSAADDSDLIKIEGVASTETKDRAGEIVLASAIKAAIPDFMARGRGPLREMHQNIAAGTVDTIEVNEARETVITATVVDPVVCRKVETQTLASLSIGGKVLARDAKDRSIITKIRLTEISLVDVGANPDAGFVLAKVDDGDDDDDDADTIAEFEASNEALATALTKIAERVEPMTAKFAAMAAENQRLAKRVQVLEAEKAATASASAPATAAPTPSPVEMFRKAEGALDDLSDLLDGIMGRVERAERTDALIRATPAGQA